VSTAVETVKARYERFVSTRDPFLRRARSAASLTIPSLLPPDGHNATAVLPTPFQGLGARGVNNLASKLLLALLPPNQPFFRLHVDQTKIPEIETDRDFREEVFAGLGRMEQAVKSEIELSGVRVPTFEALKQLLVAGNVLAYLPPTGGMRLFRLDRYVVRRDPMGMVLEIIVKENISPIALPENVRIACKVTEQDTAQNGVEVYTYVRREEGKWTVRQEINGHFVPGSNGTYPLDKSPWIALRFTAIDNEDYGRGFVEEYYGDLRSLEALTQAIVEGSAAAARILFLVKPNGNTNPKTVTEAPNGAVRSGNADDVTVVQMQKYNDFRVAFETIQSIVDRLSYAFMLNSAVQRDGERVTAEEIRYVAGELDDSMGGVYSVLSVEFQMPLVRRLMHQMERKNKLPTLPSGVVTPMITTGLEALGRGYDLQQIKLWLQDLEPLGPDAIDEIVNTDAYALRAATARNIDTKGLLRSKEERQQRAQQKAMMQAAVAAAPNAMKAVAPSQ
jgi:hypothetical protein